jgi:Kef-type K+ transport system membrane component KefB
MEASLTNLLIIVAAIVVAPLIANALPRVKVPVVVIEIALGILIGPQVLRGSVYRQDRSHAWHPLNLSSAKPVKIGT